MAGVRKRMADGAAPYLNEGEEVQVAFPAKQGGKLLVVVATNRRFLVFRQSMILAKPTGEPLHEAPRSTRIGPPKGLTYKMDALGVPLQVIRRYYTDVEAADAALGTEATS
jgi:hypothetical protein